MKEDLKTALALLFLGIILIIYGFLSKYIKDNKNREPVTKKEKISKGLKDVIYVGYVTRGILGIIVIFISIIFFIKYFISLI